MIAVMKRPLLDKVQSFARQAQLTSVARETLEITPDVAGVLANYLREALTTTQDQAWFWSEEWQAGEREAEADLAAGRYETFDTMEDLKTCSPFTTRAMCGIISIFWGTFNVAALSIARYAREVWKPRLHCPTLLSRYDVCVFRNIGPHVIVEREP